ncbi:MAG: hypothetical protein QOF60_932 [Actinomycetota bacterium]|jgi:hypothetical protein|nr:hypothetical protein [Actinomycetota bacterium]
MSSEDELADGESSPSASFRKCLEPLMERLSVAGISSTEVPSARPTEFELFIEMPTVSGGTAPVHVMNAERAQLLLDSAFEEYLISDTYDAIHHTENRYFECRLGTYGSVGPLLTARRVFKIQQIDRETVLPVLAVPSQEEGVSIELGPWSRSLRSMGNLAFSPAYFPSIRVSGLEGTVAEVERRAADLADALFFQVDLSRGVALHMVKRLNQRVRRRVPSAPAAITLPAWRYDQEPMALYWYGRSAESMPLLQFLAYYQVLEFYFPAFSRAEALRRVKRVLKSPTFSPASDSDLARVLQAVGSSGQWGYGDERAQLRATIDECVDDDVLREFVESDEDRKRGLATKSALSEFRVDLRRTDTDLRSQVVARIYDLRCKIVHTKGTTNDVDLLLPFSHEASLMGHDIALLNCWRSRR